jgi:hypothetical protein
MTRLSSFVFGVAALALVPAASAHAQAAPSDPYNASRFSVEPYLSQTWTRNDVTDERDGSGGVGVRVMFGRSAATRALGTLFNRARAGAFVTYSSASDDVKQLNYGVQGDFPLFANPGNAGFHLDPFVSLGLGAIHTSVDAAGGTNITSNDFALTPAVGTLIPILGSIQLRADLRDAVLFGDETTNNFIIEGGISIGF